jgi:PadR family transcriptional regulator, regulatory protein PadR
MARGKAEVLQGTLDLILLRLLRAGAANGWDLTRSIQAVSRGLLDVNYGSVYPALRRLEAAGLVKARWEASANNRRARIYELTAAGRKQLVTEEEDWKRYTRAIDYILSHEGGLG